MVEEISENEYHSLAQKPVAIIDFFAEWCMPCAVQSPIVEELALKFKDRIHFAKVNVDENGSIAQKFKIMSIPTLVVLKRGKEVERIIGLLQPEMLEEKIRRFL